MLPPWATIPDSSIPPDSPAVPTGSGEPPVQLPPAPIAPEPPGRIPWSVPKSSLSRFGSSVRSGKPVSNALKSAASGFVRSSGGGRRAAQASIQGRASVARLGTFLSTISREGASQAARSLGLQEYVGGSVDTLLAAIVNYLAPEGAFIEDAIARRAASETAVQLAETYSLEDNGLAALENLASNDHASIIEQCIANYIYYRMVDTLAGSLETDKPIDTVISTEQHLRDHINGLLNLAELNGTSVATLDWQGGQGAQFVERLYQEAFELIEAAK